MFFFIFSFAASLLGGIGALSVPSTTYYFNLSVNNPFSGLTEFWPFLMILIVLLLGILWYQSLKNIKKNKGTVTAQRRKSGLSVGMTAIITVFAIALMLTPYYFEMRLHTMEKAEASQTTEILLQVHGMDCGGCEALINRRVGSIEGVKQVMASNLNKEVHIIYERNKVDENTLVKMIEETGYEVVYQ